MKEYLYLILLYIFNILEYSDDENKLDGGYKINLILSNENNKDVLEEIEKYEYFIFNNEHTIIIFVSGNSILTYLIEENILKYPMYTMSLLTIDFTNTPIIFIDNDKFMSIHDEIVFQFIPASSLWEVINGEYLMNRDREYKNKQKSDGIIDFEYNKKQKILNEKLNKLRTFIET